MIEPFHLASQLHNECSNIDYSLAYCVQNSTWIFPKHWFLPLAFASSPLCLCRLCLPLPLSLPLPLPLLPLEKGGTKSFNKSWRKTDLWTVTNQCHRQHFREHGYSCLKYLILTPACGFCLKYPRTIGNIATLAYMLACHKYLLLLCFQTLEQVNNGPTMGQTPMNTHRFAMPGKHSVPVFKWPWTTFSLRERMLLRTYDPMIIAIVFDLRLHLYLFAASSFIFSIIICSPYCVSYHTFLYPNFEFACLHKC